VLFQFLSESVMTVLLGGFLGLLIGAIGTKVGEWLMGWQLALTWESVVYTFLISLTMSLISGVYPAYNAARLNPITVLKSP
jgi:putative ABC transport system permease protein